MRIRFRRTLGVLSVAVAGIVLAACSSSGSGTKASSTTTGSNTSGAATVAVKSGPLGSYLTDGSGRTLYLFAVDTNGKSSCNGSCAAIWLPLTTTGAPQAQSGVTASMLTTVKRDDGSTQVVYNGHPLYRYVSDTSAGQATGQGVNLNGGLWWVVSPSGNAIHGAGSSPSTGSSGGGAWG
jgi:predicted lipoprotein with Yx(FWY)xxD motif